MGATVPGTRGPHVENAAVPLLCAMCSYYVLGREAGGIKSMAYSRVEDITLTQSNAFTYSPSVSLEFQSSHLKPSLVRAGHCKQPFKEFCHLLFTYTYPVTSRTQAYIHTQWAQTHTHIHKHLQRQCWSVTWGVSFITSFNFLCFDKNALSSIWKCTIEPPLNPIALHSQDPLLWKFWGLYCAFIWPAVGIQIFQLILFYPPRWKCMAFLPCLIIPACTIAMADKKDLHLCQ